MKKSLLFFLLIFFKLCFSQSAKDLHGKWMGIDGDQKTYVTFYPDGFISFNEMDGKDFTIPTGSYKGKKAQIKYEVDSSVTPFKIRLIISFNNGKEIEEGEFNRGLIEFTKKDEILFYLDSEQKNPDKIDASSSGTMLLKKESDL